MVTKAWLAMLLATLVLESSALAADPFVSNVRASQLADKQVEVLYDLAGGPAGGSTVLVTFSSDGGTTWTIVPAANTLKGHVGTGVRNGTSRRILWSAASSLPAGTFGSTFRARVTAYDSSVTEMTVSLPGNVPLVLMRIPAGTFMMGSPANERSRNPDEVLHQVTLTQPYWFSKYEVTQAQWQAVMGTPMPTECGNWGVGPTFPVYCVSWNDIAGTNGFMQRLNTYLGTTTYRLPTEAEWERAARAETSTRFYYGEVLECVDNYPCQACAVHDQYMVWCGNNLTRAEPVGSKVPNAFGLYDMHGNLWEWVQDRYGAYPSTPVTDPTGGTSSSRVYRSCAWDAEPARCRSAYRNSMSINTRGSNWGFRVVGSL